MSGPGRTFAGSRVRHGTLSGHTMHWRLGEEPCDACRTAKAAYDRNLKNAEPGYVQSQRDRARAQTRALKELKYRHKAEYDALYRHYCSPARDDPPPRWP